MLLQQGICLAFVMRHPLAEIICSDMSRFIIESFVSDSFGSYLIVILIDSNKRQLMKHNLNIAKMQTDTLYLIAPSVISATVINISENAFSRIVERTVILVKAIIRMNHKLINSQTNC